MLPATKSVPKEMLPLLDRPGIQYAVEEAVRCGADHVVIVLGEAGDCIREHFAPAAGLELALADRGAVDLLQQLRRVGEGVRIDFCRQEQPRGLGDAIAAAGPHLDGGPFAVILPDEVLAPDDMLLAELARIQRRLGGSVVSLVEVAAEQVDRYGIVAPQHWDGDICRIERLVEKPVPAEAPSRLAISGRYCLSPDVLAVLPELEPGRGGEIQLTDALQRLVGQQPLHGLVHRGRRFDAGTLTGYLAANVFLARLRPRLWAEVSALLGEGGPCSSG